MNRAVYLGLMGLSVWAGCNGAPAGNRGLPSDAAVVADAGTDCECSSAAHGWVVVVDVGLHLDGNDDHPGPDICGIEVVCEGVTHLGVEAVLDLGDGVLCTEPQDGCPVSRVEAEAALGPIEAMCSPLTRPSDYVVLGIDGSLAVRFDVGRPCGLVGCQIRVEELEGPILDLYRVFACTDPSFADCREVFAPDEPLHGPQELGCCSCDEIRRSP